MEDGSLKKIASDADKAAASTKKAGDAANRYQKGQKGVAQAGMNSTKAFSKMRDEIGGGGSVLVGAYAALAANVFALTAFFGALSRAARATQLEEGLLAMGEASGVAMHSLSRGLVEATGHAISLEESMRSVALITSAGIDPASIERFGDVARKAATALGRDVQDSISRLTRGVTKLEPELLDELGIMVRLDEASKKYAESLGKNVTELTRYEKQQAFLNATLEEGEKKFGALGNVDVNAFDKLSATLQNLGKETIGGVAAGLDVIVGYLASSPGALLGVLAMFGATISSTVLGSLSEMAEKTAEAAKENAGFSRANMESAEGLNTSSRTLKNFSKALEDGKNEGIAYEKMLDGQAKSMQTFGRWKKAGNLTQEEFNKKQKASKLIINNATIALNQHNLAMVESQAATAQAHFAQGEFTKGAKALGRSLKLTGKLMVTAIRNMMSLRTGMNAASVSAKALKASLKAVGSGLMAMLGPLGLVLSLGSLLIDALKAIFNFFKSDETKKFEEKSKALAEAQKELKNNLEEQEKAFDNQSKKIIGVNAVYTAYSNTLSTFLDKYDDMNLAADKASKGQGEQKKALFEFISASQTLTNLYEKESGQKLNRHKIDIQTARDMIASEKQKAEVIKGVAAAAKGGQDAVTKYINAGKVKTQVGEILGAISDFNKSLFEMEDGKVIKIKAELEGGKAGALIAETMTVDQAALFNVAAEKKEIDRLEKFATEARKNIIDDEARLAKLPERPVSREQQAERKALLDIIAGEKALIKEVRNRQQIQAAGMQKELVERQRVLEVRNQEEIIAKNAIATAKAQVAEEKVKFANTHTHIKALLDAEDKLLESEQARHTATLEFYDSEIAGLKARGSLSQAEQDMLASYESKRQKTAQDLAVSQAKTSKARLERELKISKVMEKAAKESEKARKANLDLIKKELSFLKEQQTLAEKQAEIAQRKANREAGFDSGITPSQKAALKLDEDSRKRRKAIIEQEAKAKKAQLSIEKALLEARLTVLKEEIKVINAKRKEQNATPLRVSLIDTAPLDNAIAGITDAYKVAFENVNTEKQIGLDLLEEEKNTLDVQKLKTVETAQINRVKNEQALKLLGIQQKITSDLNTQASAQETIAKLANQDAMGNEKSRRVGAKLDMEAANRRATLAQAEYDLKIAQITAEEALLESKFALMKAEMEASDGGLSDTEKLAINQAEQALNLSKAANTVAKDTAKVKLDVVKAETAAANANAVEKAGREGGFAAALQTAFGQKDAKKEEPTLSAGETALVAAEKKNQELQKEANILLKGIVDKIGGKAPEVGTTPAGTPPVQGTDGTIDTITQANQVGNAVSSTVDAGLSGSPEGTVATDEGTGIDGAANKLANLRGLIAGTATDMALLGPEGEGASQVLNGALVMSEAFDKEASSMERAGAMISGLANMMEGNSKMKIARIDQEIEAEKRRDGKSAESVAKLKALEKKKEAEQKKAFKNKKNMQMAQTVINTAAGIMEYMSDKNIPMAVATGILGAAQLAIISSQKYSGGSASAPSASMPNKVSSGERKNTVDLSKANNAAGEIAYARGAQGTGSGMTDFKPAFTGYKHRAEGGPTGFIVGEQGPELFMPQQAGDIIPAGQTEEITQAATSNISFNINAVDAKGVEDMLLSQRGNIIGMIKEAANENGELFLEDVEEIIY